MWKSAGLKNIFRFYRWVTPFHIFVLSHFFFWNDFVRQFQFLKERFKPFLKPLSWKIFPLKHMQNSIICMQIVRPTVYLGIFNKISEIRNWIMWCLVFSSPFRMVWIFDHTIRSLHDRYLINRMSCSPLSKGLKATHDHFNLCQIEKLVNNLSRSAAFVKGRSELVLINLWQHKKIMIQC